MLRYKKLFDLMNRRGYNKSYLRNILSSATVAKLSKGEYVSGEVIDKICLHFHCQPGDIMEVVEVEEVDEDHNVLKKPVLVDEESGATRTDLFYETYGYEYDDKIEDVVMDSSVEVIDTDE